MTVLISGKTTFKIEVPYRLYETGDKGPKPLLVYLHGHGQDISLFEEQTSGLHGLEAYHLYIQGPYADFRVMGRDERRGYAWYLYNGKQGAFEKSLEYSSEFIQGVIDGLIPHLKITRCAVIGYSMGGYLAGYFGFTRWKHTNEIVMIGARLKTEFFTDRNWKKRGHLRALALHGRHDSVVEIASQRESIAFAKENGLNAELVEVDGGHALGPAFIDPLLGWLQSAGYSVAIHHTAPNQLPP